MDGQEFGNEQLSVIPAMIILGMAGKGLCKGIYSQGK
jgi:hypothetical protein